MAAVVTPDVCQAARSALARRLQIVLQLREGALRRTQIARLESLPQRLEVGADRVAARRGLGTVRVLIRQQLLQRRVGLLGSRQVSGLERTGELFEILHDLLASTLPLRLSRTGIQ